MNLRDWLILNCINISAFSKKINVPYITLWRAMKREYPSKRIAQKIMDGTKGEVLMPYKVKGLKNPRDKKPKKLEINESKF